MTTVRTATEPGSRDKPNEDAVALDPDVAIVVDGATARTESGCAHGTAWFAHRLAEQFAAQARAEQTLADALAAAIKAVIGLHPECDLSHPGSPSAVVTALRHHSGQVDYLVLGDATLILETGRDLQIHTQSHDHIAAAERDAATALPIGHQDRHALLVRMKHRENAMRNQPGGFWVAATDPSAADHALTGTVPAAEARRALLASDGAAALHQVYGAASPAGMLDLAEAAGPEAIIRQVRALEASDPRAEVYERTKRSDDATAVLWIPDRPNQTSFDGDYRTRHPVPHPATTHRGRI